MQTIRPGILVSLKTTLTGNVTYQRVDLEQQQDGQTAMAKWETTRQIADLEEHERATKARGKASNLIRGVCVKSWYGLICPMERADDLQSAIAQAEAIRDDFNASAVHTRIGVYVLPGYVEPDDERAVKAIRAEVAALMDAMERGIKSMDVESIRQAASQARQVGAMLDASNQERVNAAVDAARQAARTIVRRVQTAGESAEVVLADLNTGPISNARFSFLDGEPAQTEPAPALPAVSVQRMADLDVDLFSDVVEPDPAPAPCAF